MGLQRSICVHRQVSTHVLLLLVTLPSKSWSPVWTNSRWMTCSLSRHLIFDSQVQQTSSYENCQSVDEHRLWFSEPKTNGERRPDGYTIPPKSSPEGNESPKCAGVRNVPETNRQEGAIWWSWRPCGHAVRTVLRIFAGKFYFDQYDPKRSDVVLRWAASTERNFPILGKFEAYRQNPYMDVRNDQSLPGIILLELANMYHISGPLEWVLRLLRMPCIKGRENRSL